MVKERVNRTFGFLRTTAIGGIFFLLPFAVLVFLLGQITQVVLIVAKIAREFFHLETPLGYSLLILGSLTAIVLSCFLAGILARRSLARKFTRFVEKYLVMLFPRYAIFKEQLSGNIGGEIYRNRLKPVLITFDDYQRLAFEVESSEAADALPNTNSDLSTTAPSARAVIYLPGSPDPWNGIVILIDRIRVAPAPMDFNTAAGVMETLGHDLGTLLCKQ